MRPDPDTGKRCPQRHEPRATTLFLLSLLVLPQLARARNAPGGDMTCTQPDGSGKPVEYRGYNLGGSFDLETGKGAAAGDMRRTRRTRR